MPKIVGMSFAGKNLKYLRKQRGWTQEDFAGKLGIKRSLVGAYEEERAEPRLEVLETISEMFKLSFEDILLKDLTEAGTSYLEQRRRQKMGASGKGVIEFVPVKAAAGYLAGYNDPEFIDELNTFTLPMLTGGHYRAFEIMGDSMLPTPSGSVIVCEKVEALDDVKSNQAYVVVSRTDGIVYKRIQKQPRTKAVYTLVSDNPSYPPYTVEADEIAEVWKAQMIISKPMEKPAWDVQQLATLVSDLQEQVGQLKASKK